MFMNTLSFKLFKTFLKLGLTSFGGGMAMISVVEHEVVDNQNLLDKEEFFEALTIAQSMPGTIIVNLATYIGYKLGKLKGAVASAIGALAPSIICIVLVASVLTNISDYKIVQNALMGIRSVAPALILFTAIKLFKQLEFKKLNSMIIGVYLILILVFDFSAITAIFLGVTMPIIEIYFRRKLKL